LNFILDNQKFDLKRFTKKNLSCHYKFALQTSLSKAVVLLSAIILITGLNLKFLIFIIFSS